MYKFILLSAGIFLNTTSANQVTYYYKCTDNNKTTFSQLPCSPSAVAHKLVSTSFTVKPPEDYTKTLNNLEREQIIKQLSAKIRSKEHEITMLKRDRGRAEQKQLQRTQRILSDNKLNAIQKDITKQLRSISQQYKQRLNDKNKQIAALKKQLTQYK